MKNLFVRCKKRIIDSNKILNFFIWLSFLISEIYLFYIYIMILITIHQGV